MNVKIRFFSVLPILVAAFGCSSEKTDEGTVILMAGAFSKTGVSAVSTWGNAYALGADDATEGLRRAGYPTGKKLTFKTKVADTKNDVAITVARSVELVQEEGAKIVMNGTSSDTVALGKLAYDEDAANDLSVPIVCVACSSPALHNVNDTNADPVVHNTNANTEKWLFGLAMSSVPQSTVLWNIISDQTPDDALPGDLNGDGVVKISTIALNDGFGTGFQTAFDTVLKANAPEGFILEKLLHPKDADLNTYDWSGAIDKLTDTLTEPLPTAEEPNPTPVNDVPPDVVIEFTFPQFSLALVKAYASTIPFLHTHSMREKTVVLSAEGRLDGQDGTSYLPSDGTSGIMFDNRFRDVVEIPRQSQWDSSVYDGAMIFALATVAATKDMEDPALVTGAQIRDEMLNMNDPDGEVIRIGPDEFAKGVEAIAEGRPINYEGASGPCDFDAGGRALNRISHWRVANGEATDVAVYDCVSDPATCPRQP